MNRYESQAARLLSRQPVSGSLSRTLSLAGIGTAVALISVVSLVDLVAAPSPAGGCVQTWPYIDAGCGGRSASPTVAVATRPIRVVGLDSNAPAIVGKAVEQPVPAEVAAPAPAPEPASLPVAAAEPVATVSARSVPSTDGSGQSVASTGYNELAAPPIVSPIQFTEQELTFKAGAVHRRGPGPAAGNTKGVAAASDDGREIAPAPRKAVRAAGKRREHKQVYELPDGRRVTVYRRYAGEQASGAGTYGEPMPGGFGYRRSPGGPSGLY